MPEPELDNLFQTAVLWEMSGVDNYGEPVLNNPYEIDVRWEETRREAVSAEGTKVRIDAIAFVAQEIPVSSIMWLGELADLPAEPIDLKQVVVFEETPDIDDRYYQRDVLLMKYKGTVPQVGTGS